MAVLTDSDLVRRCIHGVPQHVIQTMRARWQPWPGELLVTHGRLPDRVIQDLVAQWRPYTPPAPPVRVNRWVTRMSQPAIVPATRSTHKTTTAGHTYQERQ